MILSCSNISKTFGTDVILDQIQFHINAGDRLAIVGINGAGKTTLFKIITGAIAADSGNVQLQSGKTVSYLAQMNALDDEKTVYQEVLSTRGDILELEKRLHDLESAINQNAHDLEQLERLNLTYTDCRHRYEALEGYSYVSFVKGVLNGLSFLDDAYTTKVVTLSGGQKTRLALAKLLIKKPDVLLLDEPTNHLDIEATEWLEGYLSAYNGTVVLIAHDRFFLDKVATKVLELENTKGQLFTGNYTTYREKKADALATTMKHIKKQEKEVKRQEAMIQTLKGHGRDKLVRQAKSREKALEKLTPIVAPDTVKDQFHIHLDPKHESGQDVLQVENLSKAFDTLSLFKALAFEIKKGEKVALIGPNGVGKTTLFKILLGQLPADTGHCRLGTKVFPGYYDQDHAALDATKTLMQEFHDTYPTLTEGEVRHFLAAFLFTGDDVFKTIHALSGGEKGRMALAKLMASRSNFLLMDEPTNHLDMVSKGVLEAALKSYTGTLLFISHDRYFINQVATRVLELTENGLTQYIGNYQDYVEKRDLLSKSSLSSASDFKGQLTESMSDNKAKWLASKEKATEAKRLQKKLESLEIEIHQTEQRIQAIDKALCDESVYSDHIKAQAFHEEKSELEHTLLGLYEEWEITSEDL